MLCVFILKKNNISIPRCYRGFFRENISALEKNIFISSVLCDTFFAVLMCVYAFSWFSLDVSVYEAFSMSLTNQTDESPAMA